MLSTKVVAHRCSVKKCVLKNFAKFTGKNLCQSLFFNKGLNFTKKETLAQVFFLIFAKFLSEPFFYEQLYRYFSLYIDIYYIYIYRQICCIQIFTVQIFLIVLFNSYKLNNHQKNVRKAKITLRQFCPLLCNYLPLRETVGKYRHRYVHLKKFKFKKLSSKIW